MKKRICRGVLIILVVIVAGLLIADGVVYPRKTDILDLLNVDETQIAAVEIWHNGETISVDDPKQIERILLACEGKIERKYNDYFIHYSLGSWDIRFIDQNGNATQWISAFGPDSFQYRHYFYAFAEPDKQRYETIVAIWEELNP